MRLGSDEGVAGSASHPPDWPQIAALYRELFRLTGSPVVKLNVAVATAEAGDTKAALEIVGRLELDSYHYLHSTRASLLGRLDRIEEARAAYDRALELVHSDAERRFLASWRARAGAACSSPRTASGAACAGTG